ncbi:MAG: TRAP transporter TatT component family protein [Gammaproteobacteria bacterium]
MTITNDNNAAWAVGMLLAALALGGCANLFKSATSRMANNLSAAILNQDDLETVRAGAPAYLLLIDSFIADDPDNQNMLLAGAQLYGAYASVFVEDNERRRRLAGKAKDLGSRAACIRLTRLCAVLDQPYDRFEPVLGNTGKTDVPALYGLAASWATWLQTRDDDWNAIADLPKITALFERVVKLDEAYDSGAAHLYLGVIGSLRPPGLGGKPEQGRVHFERAIELSQGRNLMAKVWFAKQYARLVFDRELHDRLVAEVRNADPVAPELTLMNTFAQHQANDLAASADEFF